MLGYTLVCIISQFIIINLIINFISIIIYHNAYMLGYTLVCKISQFIKIINLIFINNYNCLYKW